jgi:hypothetical protein
LHGKPPGKSQKKIKRILKFFLPAGGALFIGVAVLGIYSRNAKTFEVRQITNEAARTMVHVVHPARTTEEISLQLAGQTTPYTDAPIADQIIISPPPGLVDGTVVNVVSGNESEIERASYGSHSTYADRSTDHRLLPTASPI